MKIENDIPWLAAINYYIDVLKDEYALPDAEGEYLAPTTIDGIITSRINRLYDIMNRINNFDEREFTDRQDITVLCQAANEYCIAYTYWYQGDKENALYLMDCTEKIREEINK